MKYMKYANEIFKLAELYQNEIEKEAAKWKKMPEGWKSKSRKSFFKNLADESVGECMSKIKNHVDDPGSFCASLKDRVKKTTKWREGNTDNLKKNRKKKIASIDVIDQTIQDYMMNRYHLNGGRYYGMSPAAAPDYKLYIEAVDENTYNINIVLSLSRKNRYSGADINVRPSAFVSDRVKAAA